MSAQKNSAKLISVSGQAGFAHLLLIIVLALAIPLSIFAVSRQVYKRSRAQVPSTGPCGTLPCPSPPAGSLTARLYIEPMQGAFTKSQEIPAQIRVRTNYTNPTATITVNAVQAEVKFDATKLQVVRVDATTSAFAIEAERTIAPDRVVLARGNIQPVSGDALVATIVFKAQPKTLGEVLPFINIVNSAAVSDVTNTDILQSAGSATYNITSDLIGDINGDGKVDVKDLSVMLSHWQQRYALADLVFDGIVDVKDLSRLLSNWGKTAILP